MHYSGSQETYTFIDGALPNEAYKASFSFLSLNLILHSGTNLVSFQVTNEIPVVWPSMCKDKLNRYKTSAAYRWLGPDRTPLPEKMFGDFSNRIDLPHDVFPGNSVVLQAEVKEPISHGRYFLEFSMLQGHCAWFHEKNSPTEIIEVQVGE